MDFDYRSRFVWFAGPIGKLKKLFDLVATIPVSLNHSL